MSGKETGGGFGQRPPEGQRSTPPSYYDVLGVPHDATPEAIKKAIVNLQD